MDSKSQLVLKVLRLSSHVINPFIHQRKVSGFGKMSKLGDIITVKSTAIFFHFAISSNSGPKMKLQGKQYPKMFKNKMCDCIVIQTGCDVLTLIAHYPSFNT